MDFWGCFYFLLLKHKHRAIFPRNAIRGKDDSELNINCRFSWKTLPLTFLLNCSGLRDFNKLKTAAMEDTKLIKCSAFGLIGSEVCRTRIRSLIATGVNSLNWLILRPLLSIISTSLPGPKSSSWNRKFTYFLSL